MIAVTLVGSTWGHLPGPVCSELCIPGPLLFPGAARGGEGWAVIHVLSMCYLRAQLCVFLQPNSVSTGVEPGMDNAAQTSSVLNYWDFSSSLCLFVCLFSISLCIFKADSSSPKVPGCPGSCRDLQEGCWRALAENEHGICDWEQPPLQPHPKRH